MNASATKGTPGLVAPPDALRLSDYLSAKLPAFGAVRAIERLPGGQSNPTFRVRCAHVDVVLRARPAPAAELLPSAHAIEREFAVMQALALAGFPVPRVHALCTDEQVTGTAFYVMEFVEGRILREPRLTSCQSGDRRAVYDAMIDTLAALHAIDPSSIGLDGFGGQSNYFERQVRRWTDQYLASMTQAIPAMDRLIEWLPRHVPADARRRIVHGDFRLDNLILHPTRPRVIAAIDWELATIGDPIADLAYNCLPWHMPADEPKALGLLDEATAGIPTEAMYRARYERATLTATDATWHAYLAFSFFRLAAILQGVYKRALHGRATSPSALDAGRRACSMAERGWSIAQRA